MLPLPWKRAGKIIILFIFHVTLSRGYFKYQQNLKKLEKSEKFEARHTMEFKKIIAQRGAEKKELTKHLERC